MEEIWRGKQSSKPREKMIDTDEMLGFAAHDEKS